ncbi:MAG: hypothetical protein R6V75_04265 [Bacteroidales bacterium]
MTRKLIFLVVILALAVPGGRSQVLWTVNLNAGAPVNIPVPLHISQSGHPDISLLARWSSDPFMLPFYWMWRIGRINNDRGWEFEAIHHKLILENRPPEVSEFRITHGFNLLFVNRSYHDRWLNWRYGAGVILAHPENRVREQQLNEQLGLFNRGYYISGPALNVSVNRPFYPSRLFFANLELKATAGVAFVPVHAGRATVGHLSVHLIAGLGYGFLVGTKN